jgi:RNA polymerase sigma-70 factor (ECF subfamily)
LAAGAAAGDLEAFEELVNRHRMSVYRLARSITGNHDDADDAAQEAFFRLYRSLSSYDPQRPFTPYLRRIAYNTSLNVLRAGRARGRGVTVSEMPDAADLSPNPYEAAETKAMGKHFQVALEQLSAELRGTFLLRASEGMSYSEIAQATGVRIGTVMSRLSRARERILKTVQAAGMISQRGDGQ